MQTKTDLRNSWLNFIEKYFSNQFITSDVYVNYNDPGFEIKNVMGTGIKFDYSYGFLTVNFMKSKWIVADFIGVTDISYESVDQGNGVIFRSMKWSAEHYPCRIYGGDTTTRLRFYTSDEIVELDDLLNSFITVFQSVIFTIVKLKINTAKE